MSVSFLVLHFDDQMLSEKWFWVTDVRTITSFNLVLFIVLYLFLVCNYLHVAFHNLLCFKHCNTCIDFTIAAGKMQKSLPQLLQEYDLPIGIFPKDATNYELNEEIGKLTVYMPTTCEIGYKDTVLRYATVVTGYLEKGRLTNIEGIKTKFMIWVKVTSISTEGPKIHFTAGMKKSKNKEIFQVLRNGITIDKF